MGSTGHRLGVQAGHGAAEDCPGNKHRDADKIEPAARQILASLEEPSALGGQLREAREVLFSEQPGQELMTLFALAFAQEVESAPVETAVLPAYVIDPRLSLPPALVERGWTGDSRAVLNAEPGAVDKLEVLLRKLALSHAGSDASGVVSWKRKSALSLRYRSSGSCLRVEIEGVGAGRLAALIAEMVGGALVPEPEDVH